MFNRDLAWRTCCVRAYEISILELTSLNLYYSVNKFLRHLKMNRYVWHLFVHSKCKESIQLVRINLCDILSGCPRIINVNRQYFKVLNWKDKYVLSIRHCQYHVMMLRILKYWRYHRSSEGTPAQLCYNNFVI
jgi:hypothetical protein